MFKKFFKKKLNLQIDISEQDIYIEIEPSIHTSGSCNSPDSNIVLNPMEYNISILIVDDAKINRYVLRRYITRLKKNVYIIEAENGKDAIEKVMEHNFDIIFMDLKMNVMNGSDSAEVILKIYPNLPIIACTGNIESETITNVLKIGMRSCLSKPVSLSELNNVFDKFFPKLV
jgi:two-component system autoinducer 1 sensor kinase/phosphatase LuxN